MMAARRMASVVTAVIIALGLSGCTTVSPPGTGAGWLVVDGKRVTGAGW